MFERKRRQALAAGDEWLDGIVNPMPTAKPKAEGSAGGN